MNEEINKLIEEFEARLKAMKEEYNQDWNAEYFYIASTGDIYSNHWVQDESDTKSYEIGNVFKTKEEALFEVEKRKVLHELKQLGRPFRPNKCNYGICLHHDSPDNQKELFYKSATEVEQIYGDYYFDSIPKAKDAVYRIGEDRIKKYLFGIEE